MGGGGGGGGGRKAPSPFPRTPFPHPPKTFVFIESLITAFPYGFMQGKAVFLIR